MMGKKLKEIEEIFACKCPLCKGVFEADEIDEKKSNYISIECPKCKKRIRKIWRYD